MLWYLNSSFCRFLSYKLVSKKTGQKHDRNEVLQKSANHLKMIVIRNAAYGSLSSISKGNDMWNNKYDF